VTHQTIGIIESISAFFASTLRVKSFIGLFRCAMSLYKVNSIKTQPPTSQNSHQSTLIIGPIGALRNKKVKLEPSKFIQIEKYFKNTTKKIHCLEGTMDRH